MSACTEHVNESCSGFAGLLVLLTRDPHNLPDLVTPSLDLPILISALDHEPYAGDDVQWIQWSKLYELIHNKTIGLSATNEVERLLKLRQRPCVAKLSEANNEPKCSSSLR